MTLPGYTGSDVVVSFWFRSESIVPKSEMSMTLYNADVDFKCESI